MRIDSHQHFWIYNPTDYVWMTDSMHVLQQDYLPGDLKPLLDEVGFDGSIAVQARQMERETAWLLELAAKNDFVQGVVGWVDFKSSELDVSLERFAAHPKLKGVRELIHDMPDVDYATSHTHTWAISKLEPLGLTYDLLLRPQHLAPALELARQFPNQRFVIDHIAKPDIAQRQLQPWHADILALAERENVYCKLSGMVSEAVWKHWRAETFRPYLDIVVEAFGTDRVMIGSDWPVCTLSGDYQATMDVVIDFTDALSEAERERVLGGNAAEFYDLHPVFADTRAVID
jgi:L-fuconolactonase